MKCINCGGDCANPHEKMFNPFIVCQTCEDAGSQIASLFETGVVLEYSDGSNEVVKLKN